MAELLIPLGAATVVVFLAIMLIPGLLGSEKSSSRRKKILNRIELETGAAAAENAKVQAIALRDPDSLTGNPALDALLKQLPTIEVTNALLVKSAIGIPLMSFLITTLVIGFLLGSFLLTKIGVAGYPVGFLMAHMVTRWWLKRKVTKRVDTFIAQFPDAVDMIVRSVRSGHPLNASLRMIADNMEAPIAEEFRQVIDEVSYGRTLNDALFSMSRRIDQPDLQFFVVVLAVQQESGGNLGEILSSLSNILRKRKQMRMKIHAMTAEGRMTAMILGALPICVLGALQVISPDYLKPLFNETLGNIILFLAAGLIGSAFLIVNKMVKIDI